MTAASEFPLQPDAQAVGVAAAIGIGAGERERGAPAGEVGRAVPGVPDECDLAEGSSEDCNLNETPDECEPMKHWKGGVPGPPDPPGGCCYWDNPGNWEEGDTPASGDPLAPIDTKTAILMMNNGRNGGSMPRLDNSIDIKAPVDRVFGYIADATAHPEWVKWTKRAEVTSIESKGVGATTAEVMQVGPKKENIETLTTEFKDGQFFTRRNTRGMEMTSRLSEEYERTLRKFGGDSLPELLRNHQGYLDQLKA